MRDMVLVVPESDQQDSTLVPHAARRWSQAVIQIIDSRTDVRTIELWGKLINASAGAIKNWCATAGIQPRRSLVFCPSRKASRRVMPVSCEASSG